MPTSNKTAPYAHFGNPFSSNQSSETSYQNWLFGNTRYELELFQEVAERKQILDTIPEYIIISNLPKITPKSASSETGGKVGTNQDINPSYLSKEGISVNEAVDYIKAEYFQEVENIEESEIRDIIIDILTSKKSDYINDITKESELENVIDYSQIKPEQREWILNQINEGKLDRSTLL